MKRKLDPIVNSSPLKQKSLTAFFQPSAISTNATPSAPPVHKSETFSKADWVSSLSEEQRALLQLEIEHLDITWLSVLKDELTKPSFLNLKRFLAEEKKAGKTVFPPPQDIYSWSRSTPLNKVKVVILGQDPYHNHNQAHGLSFSVRKGVPVPPSLKNIYIALKKDYPEFSVPKHGCLSPWADQGVLLLNACLTVRAHEANSHNGRGWEEFTSKVLQAVVKHNPQGVVFMAWGSPAAKRLAGLNMSNCLFLKAVHPSPLSASRGFFDCNHFKKANDWLAQKFGIENTINWNCLGVEDGNNNNNNKYSKTANLTAKSTENKITPSNNTITKDTSTHASETSATPKDKPATPNDVIGADQLEGTSSSSFEFSDSEFPKELL